MEKFTVAEVAAFFRKGEIPHFLLTDKNIALLSGYPKSVRNYAGFIRKPSFLLIFFATAVAFYYFNSQLTIIATFVVFVALHHYIGEVSQENQIAMWNMEDLASDLSKLVNYTDLAPLSLVHSNLSILTVRKMVVACKNVLNLQAAKAAEDPVTWASEREQLTARVRDMYNLFLQYALVEPGGYGRYYDIAKTL